MRYSINMYYKKEDSCLFILNEHIKYDCVYTNKKIDLSTNK